MKQKRQRHTTAGRLLSEEREHTQARINKVCTYMINTVKSGVGGVMKLKTVSGVTFPCVCACVRAVQKDKRKTNERQIKSSYEGCLSHHGWLFQHSPTGSWYC